MDKCHERKEEKVEFNSLDLIKEPELPERLILVLPPADHKGRVFTATDTNKTFQSYKVDGDWQWVWMDEKGN